MDKCLSSIAIQCSQWGSSSESYIQLRNIGNKVLSVKALTKSQSEVSCNSSHIHPSLYHGYWDGCSSKIYFDDSIEDIVIEYNDITKKISSSFGYLRNSYFLKNEICAREINNELELALCTCEQCCNFFDFQVAFVLDRIQDCEALYSLSCPCYETSHMSFEEIFEYQVHTICTQCKYDSHCRTFNPHAFCLQYTPGYIIGNPFNTNPADYGFKNLIRDKGRVTNGLIKGDSCDCETNRFPYTGVGGNVHQYKVYPKYQIVGSVQECIQCMKDPFSLEASCHIVRVQESIDLWRGSLYKCFDVHFRRFLCYLHSKQ